jgi:hypothetical protein
LAEVVARFNGSIKAVFALLAGGFLMRAAERYWKGTR